jgi:hypothetical protein
LLQAEKVILEMTQARLETTMRSFPSSFDADQERMDLKRKRTTHEVKPRMRTSQSFKKENHARGNAAHAHFEILRKRTTQEVMPAHAHYKVLRKRTTHEVMPRMRTSKF